MYFQHNGTIIHFSRFAVVQANEHHFKHWISRDGPNKWSVRFPDLNPIYLSHVLQMREVGNQGKLETREALIQKIY